MMVTILSEDSFKKSPEGQKTYEEFLKFMTNKQDEQKRTPLMWVSYVNFNNRETIKAKEEKRLTAAKFLIEKGSDIHLKDEHGWTALSWAAWTGMPTIVSLLIENGAAIDIPDLKGQTPLMIASIRGNDEVVQLLLGAGADRDLKNSEGKVALDFVKEYINRYPERKVNYEKIISDLATVTKVEESQPAEESAPAEEAPAEENAPAEEEAE